MQQVKYLPENKINDIGIHNREGIRAITSINLKQLD